MLLNVVSQGPEADRGIAAGAPPIVLLHGLFGRARNLGFFQRRLAAQRRVLAIDLRSHGASPHGPMTYAAMADDLAETLDAHGALPAVLVGHSMGGKTAMMLALTTPAAVSRLVVADIPPAVTGHGNAGLAAALLDIDIPPGLDRAGADRLLQPAIPGTDIRQLMMQNLRLGQDAGWTIGLAEIVASIPEIEGWPELPEGRAYAGPTLFLAGGRSPYIQPRDHAAMRRLFPNHILETIEDAGHWLHAERPARFLELLQDFVGLSREPEPELPGAGARATQGG